jgi:hypothetical protein
MRLYTQLLLIWMILVCYGCHSHKLVSVETRPFPVKNIAAHTFKLNINVLKDSILSLFSSNNMDLQLDDSLMNAIFYDTFKGERMTFNFEAETNKNAVFEKDYFSDAGTANDICLNDFRDVWLSKYYVSNGGQPLKYDCSFIVKFAVIDSNTTSVHIIAYKPELINGTNCCGMHGEYANYIPAEPTTIEEYALLLFTAKELGDSTMLPLKLPVQ